MKRKLLLCFMMAMLALTSLVIAQGSLQPRYYPPASKSIQQTAYVEKTPTHIEAVTGPTIIVKEAATTRYQGEYVIAEDIVFGSSKPVYAGSPEEFNITVLPVYNQKPVELYTKPDENCRTFANALAELVVVDNSVLNDHYMEVQDIGGKHYYVDIRKSHVIPYHKDKEKAAEAAKAKERNKPGKLNLTLDITQKTNMTPQDVLKYTAGTGLEGIENAVVDIERQYGINCLFTLALATVESGAGESWLAVNRNNLFGIAAYDSDTDAAYQYPSKSACVYSWGELIYEDYFCEGYLTLYDINGKYASNPDWHSDVGSIMQSIASEL